MGQRAVGQAGERLLPLSGTCLLACGLALAALSMPRALFV